MSINEEHTDEHQGEDSALVSEIRACIEALDLHRAELLLEGLRDPERCDTLHQHIQRQRARLLDTFTVDEHIDWFMFLAVGARHITSEEDTGDNWNHELCSLSELFADIFNEDEEDTSKLYPFIQRHIGLIERIYLGDEDGRLNADASAAREALHRYHAVERVHVCLDRLELARASYWIDQLDDPQIKAALTRHVQRLGARYHDAFTAPARVFDSLYLVAGARRLVSGEHARPGDHSLEDFDDRVLHLAPLIRQHAGLFERIHRGDVDGALNADARLALELLQHYIGQDTSFLRRYPSAHRTTDLSVDAYELIHGNGEWDVLINRVRALTGDHAGEALEQLRGEVLGMSGHLISSHTILCDLLADVNDKLEYCAAHNTSDNADVREELMMCRAALETTRKLV